MSTERGRTPTRAQLSVTGSSAATPWSAAAALRTTLASAVPPWWATIASAVPLW
jgi:hypothetical protein